VKTVTLALLFLSACQPTPTIDIDGVGIIDETGNYLADPTFPGRFQAEALAVLQYSGGSWEDLQGYVVIFSRELLIPCHDGTLNCDGMTFTSPFRNTIHLASMDWQNPTCFMNTALAHELLHVVIGDGCHHDPRFRDFAAAAEAIRSIEAGFPGACRVIIPERWHCDPTC
jgi:hypothetical protein